MQGRMWMFNTVTIDMLIILTNRWQLLLWWSLASSRFLVLVPYPSSSYSVFFKVMLFAMLMGLMNMTMTKTSNVIFCPYWSKLFALAIPFYCSVWWWLLMIIVGHGYYENDDNNDYSILSRPSGNELWLFPLHRLLNDGRCYETGN